MIYLRALLILMLGCIGALADLTVKLTPGSQLANRGTETIFSGTLTNSGTTDIFLNDLSFDFIAPAATYFTVDKNFFFENVPGVLSPGETYSGPIFKVAVSKAPSGTYFGAASILGGVDIFTQGSLPAVNFSVQIVHRPPKRVR